MAETQAVRFAVMLPQTNRIASPTALIRTAEAAEELDFHTVSVRDHIVFNGAWVTSGMRGLDVPGDERDIFEALQTLAFVASRTSRVKLGASVIIVPNRHPLLLAKQTSSLDVLCDGRLILGVGVGPNRGGDGADTDKLGKHRSNLEKEYDAFGVVGHRGERMDEYVQAVLAIWTQERPSFHGKFVEFDELDVFPKPIQQPHPPIYIGGRSDAALRRVALYGDGWIPSQITVDEVPPSVDKIRGFKSELGRDAGGETIGINVHSIIAANDEVAERSVIPTIGQMFSDSAELHARTIIGSIDTFRRRVLEYRDAGVNYIELKPVYSSIDDLIQQMRLIRDEVMPALVSA